MKRDIKFRAWNPEDKKMYEVQGLCFNGQPSVTLQYGPLKKVSAYKVVLMQFTGLQDCANRPVDIYEGDIIKVTRFEEWGTETDMISEVVFSCGVFALKQRLIDEGEVCPLSCEEHYVVIGNIYENPELLKEST